MGRKSRTYSPVTEAEEMVKDLCEKYPDVFWTIKPEQIVIRGIDNVDRSEKAVEKNPLWSKLSNVKGVERAIFAENNIGVRYIIELFWSDWNVWRDSLKLAVIAKNLLEITPDVDKKNRPDCVGFKILYKALGINWERDDGTGIPNLLLADIDFDLELRPGLEDYGDNEGDEIVEIIEEIKDEVGQEEVEETDEAF